MLTLNRRTLLGSAAATIALGGFGGPALAEGEVTISHYFTGDLGLKGVQEIFEKFKAAKGIAVNIGKFNFAANGRALSMDAADTGGFVRIVARKSDHRVLGIQAVGNHVSELSAEFATVMEMGAVLEDIAGTIHVHPTLSEAFHEAALKALGHAIHI